MYSVVEMTDGVLAVPTKWLSKTKKFCSYPKDSENVLELIKKNKDSADNWTKIPVLKYFTSANTYKEAKEKTEAALTLSDLDEDNMRKSRGSRKRKTESDSDSNDENDVRKPTKQRTLDHIEVNNTSEEDSDIIDTSLPLQTQKNKKILQSSEGSKSKSDDNTLTSSEQLQYTISVGEENLKQNKKLLIEILQMKKILVDLQSHVQNVNSNLHTNTKETSTSQTFSLPVKKLFDFEQLENQLLKDEKQKEKMIQLLARRGGRDFSDLTGNILYRAMNDEVAGHFSYFGRQKKKSFKDTQLCECVKTAVLNMFPKTTENLIESKIGSWLAQATVRQTRNEKKIKEKENNHYINSNTNNNDGVGEIEEQPEDPLAM